MPGDFRFRTFLAWSALALLCTAWSHAADAPPGPLSPADAALHDRMVGEYMAGKWDDLSADLTAHSKETIAWPSKEKADVDYIRKAVGECRPAWWKLCKAGEKTKFRPVVWGQTLIATYDPAAKTNVQINFVNGSPSVVVTWDAKEMDDPAEAEHGFTKGELNDLTIWSTLGTAESWIGVPLRSQTNMKEDAKAQLSRFLSVRGTLASAYYAMPRARRWSLWLGMSAYNPEHAKDLTIMARRSIGAMFIAEVLSHPQTYGSMKFPADLPADDAEGQLASHLKSWLEKNPLTFAEDCAMRDALKAFAAANDNKARATAKIVLPNGLFLSLDPPADKPFAAERDAWVKEHLKSR